VERALSGANKLMEMSRGAFETDSEICPHFNSAQLKENRMPVAKQQFLFTGSWFICKHQ
jgi:hypothetical protein